MTDTKELRQRIEASGLKYKYNRPVMKCKTKFTVAEMEVSEDHVITQLSITAKGVEVFGYGRKSGVVFPRCEVCGEEIVPVKKRDGSLWQPPEIVEYGKRVHGKAMCAACLKKASKKQANDDGHEKQAVLVM